MPLIGSLGAAASRGFGQFLQKITAVLNTDAFFKYVTLLLTGNPPTSTFVTDASTNNLQVTINGDTKPNGFSPNENGYYSCYFDGTGDRILLSGSNLTFTGNFTVEAWVYIRSLATVRPILCIGDDRIGSGVLFSVNTTGKLLMFASNAAVLTGTGTSVVANTWTHVAFVRSGTTITGYVNGVVQGTATSSATFTGIASYIGMEFYNSAPGAEFLGNISNLRVVDNTAVYTSAFTPSTTPLTAISGTALLACQANRFIDNSSSPKAMTVVGQTYIAGFQPFTPNPSFATYGSTYFDGTGDYLTYAANSAVAFGTANFTIEMWVYLNTVTGVHGFLSRGFNSVGWSIVQSGTILYFEWASTNITSSATLAMNKWTHIAVTRVGTGTNQTVIYVDGIPSGSGTVSTDFNDSNAVLVGEYRQSGYPFNGYISNVRIIKGTALYTAAFTPPTTQLTAVTNTSLLTCQTNQPVNNNVFLDSSSNNLAITRAGNTTQGSLNPYGGNWSNYFDGSGDYLNCSASSAQFGTGDFTIECWIYPTSLAAIQVIVDFRTTSTAIFGQIYLATNGTVHFYLPPDIATTNTVTLNAWNHIAISRSAGTLKMFINGTSGYSAANSGTYNAVGTYIGISISNTNGFTGYISNMRFITGTGIYTSNFTPSTTPLTAIAKTSLLTCQSNRFIDNSNNNFTITKTNDVKAQRFSPFSPVLSTPTSYSNYFDGNGDYLSTPTTTALNLATGDFTVEAWVYVTSSTNVDQTIIASNQSWGSGAVVLKAYHGGNVSFTAYDNNSGGVAMVSYPATLNTWTHVAFTRVGTTFTLYIDGTNRSTATSSINVNFAPAGGTYIGYDGPINATTGYLSGYISNLRVIKGTAIYTANFTPPTTPLTAVSGTSLLTCQSSTIIDNSANNFAITATGDVAARTQNPFGVTNTDAPYTPATYGGSMYFDGTNDYLIAPLGVNSALGNTCTVELWYYPLTSPPTARLINNSTAAGSSLDVYDLDSKIGFANQVATTTTVRLNAWTHIAFVVTSGTLKIYFNGVSQPLSGTSTGINITATGDTWIGGINGYSQWTNGYMSNIRLVKGTALYTANFAPPVAPLQAVTNTSLLLLGSNGAVYDSAMLNNQETVGDAKVTTAVSKFGGSSMYFDGSDNLSIPLNTSYKIGTGEFTIEAWVYHTNSGSYAGYYYGGNAGLVLRRTDANKLEISQDGIASIAISTNTIPSNQWVHVAGTRSGTTVRIFINGVLEGTATYSGNFAPTTAATVGSISNVAGYYMTGYIDDLRITNGYARYTQTFAVPTQPFPVQ